MSEKGLYSKCIEKIVTFVREKVIKMKRERKTDKAKKKGKKREKQGTFVREK